MSSAEEFLPNDIIVVPAQKTDYPEILAIQKKAFYSEAEFYQNFSIQPLTQTIEEMDEECREKVVLKAVVGEKIVGSVRANSSETVCQVNKLVVLPEFQKKGIGQQLLNEVESYFPEIQKFTLQTGAYSESNIRLYTKIGYQIVGRSMFAGGVEAVVLEKIKSA
jgi:ribosomal protein S18 acetylase RimI-like enzyme